MAKRRRDTDSGADVASVASGCKTVFVATSLDTHLAIALSFSDTLADFKRKIMIQHEQCFPGFGALRIHSVKVKYQRNFYHLHESNMLVSSAFEGYDGRWSPFVGASSSLEAAKEKPSIDLSNDNDKLDNQRAPKAICAIAWKSPGESSLNAGMVYEHVQGTCQENLSLLMNRNLEENSYRSKDDLKGINENFQSDDSDEPRAKVGLTAKKQKLVHCVHVVGDSASDISRIGPSHRFNDETAGNLESFAGKNVSDDVQRSKKDAGGSLYKTSFSGAKVLPESENLNASESEPAAEESHVLEKKVVHRDNSDLGIARQLHVLTPAAISESSKITKKKRRKQEHGTNPYVTDDQAATSKPRTVSEESVLPEACGSETVVVANCGRTNDDESMMALTGFGQNDDKEEEGRFKSKHEVCLVGSVKPSHHGKTTIANEETVLSLGIADVNKSTEADNSAGNKSKPTKRRAKKSDVPEQDHLDIQHDSGAAPKAHVENEKKDESVLPQKDPDKSEENSELAVNHLPRVMSSEGNKHLNSSEENLVRKESPSASALNMRDELDASKCAGVLKKKKGKKPAASDPSALNGSHSQNIDVDYVADQSILSSSEGNEASKTVLATDPHKKGNMASNNDEVSLPLTEFGQTHSKNDVLDLYSGKESYDVGSPARASVQYQIHMEQANGAQCLPMDQANGKVENIETTKKKKKKTAKKTEVGQTHSMNEVLDLYSRKESYDVGSPARASVQDQINMEQAKEAQCLLMDQADGKVENIETTKKKNKNTAKKTKIGETHSRNDVLDLYSGKESYDVGSPAKASVQDQINMEQAKEAQCLLTDQADGKIENIETTKKKKKNTAKKTAASTGGDQELASSVEKLRDVDYAHTLKVKGADEKGIVDQSGVSGLGPEKSVDLKCTGKLELLQNADCPEVPPYEIKNRSEIGRATVVGKANDTIASDGENGSVKFREYFVPSEDHKEAESTDLREKTSLVEAVKKVPEQKVLTKGKRKASKSLGNQKDSDGRNSDDNKHPSSVSKEKQSKKVTEKEILTKSGKRFKIPNHSDAKVNTRKKSVEPGDIGSDSNTTCTPQLQKNDESLTSPNLNSISNGSEKVLTNKSNRKKQEGLNDSTAAEGKVSRRKGGDPYNSSQEKRLLATPGVIFGAGRGDSSGDESGIGKSGSTTRTPSDKSSSSGDSTSEGSYDSARKKKGGWKSIGSKWFDTRNVPLDEIFRSSSRYKLKLSASQPQAADTDSLPVDFVPDSQPIH